MPTPTQIFENMPERFDPNTAGDMNATVQFNLTGDNGGEWYVTVADGELAVEEGTADDPKSTVIMDADDFVAMSTGELNAMSAFMGGKVKVEGDLNTVMKLQPALGL